MLKVLGIMFFGIAMGVLLLLGAANEGERLMKLEREYVQQNY